MKAPPFPNSACWDMWELRGEDRLMSLCVAVSSLGPS